MKMKCYWCGDDATHYCTGCGKYVCDKWLCKTKSIAATLGVKVSPSS